MMEAMKGNKKWNHLIGEALIYFITCFVVMGVGSSDPVRHTLMLSFLIAFVNFVIRYFEYRRIEKRYHKSDDLDEVLDQSKL
jgi:Ca2+/Na+ antiporter